MTALLGFTVRDKVSNLQGVAICYAQTLHRMPQYGIQPAGDGTSFPEAIMVDEGDLVALDDIERAAFSEAPACEIGLDQTVRETITGFTGKTVTKYTYKDGCVSFNVLATKLDKDGKYPESLLFPVQRLEPVPVKAGLLGRARIEEPKDPPAKPRGGPRSLLSAMRAG